MAGPPVKIESDNFIKTIVLIPGMSGIGKTTLAHNLGYNNTNIMVFYLDSWCYEFFNITGGQPFNLQKQLSLSSTETINGLIKHILTKIKSFTCEYKLYILEGFVLSVPTVFKDVSQFCQKESYIIWVLEKYVK